MNRLYNELTADEVRRGTGVKVGDFGTGGRTYVRYRTSSEQCDRFCIKVLTVIALLLSIGAMVYFENDLYLLIGCVQEAGHTAYTYGSEPRASSAFNNRLVHTTSSATHQPALDNPGVSDGFFDIAPVDPSVMLLRRQTEYCQWEEIEVHTRVKVGEEPGRCTQGSGGDNCRGVSCHGRGQGGCSSPCCSWQGRRNIYEDRVTYNYHKGWRRHRINSLRFDNPTAYHNPQRDPAPSAEFWVNSMIDIAGGAYGAEGLRVPPKNFHEGLDHGLPSSLQPLFGQDVKNLNPMALQAGFTEASHEHVYSRVPEDGWNHPIVKAAASYLVDGVIDVNSISKATGIESLLSKGGLGWITKGTCNTGDIRVSWHTKSVPKSISVLGQQQAPNLLVPYRYTNGQVQMFSSDQPLPIGALLDGIASNKIWWTKLYRGIAFLVISIAVMFGQELLFNRTGWLSGLGIILIVFGGSLALTWYWLYGMGGVTIPLAITLSGTLICIVRHSESVQGVQGPKKSL